MKRFLLTLAAGSALIAVAPGVASAQAWMSINQRQANLDARIDQGVRSGELTRAEAITLRGDFRTLEQLEAQYRRSGGGLDARERADLDRRFDQLSSRVYAQKHDRDDRGGGRWMSINQRQANLDERIDRGVRTGALTRGEAARLRVDFQALARLEAQYGRSDGGLSMRERADLDRRFDQLSARIRIEARDRQHRG